MRQFMVATSSTRPMGALRILGNAPSSPSMVQDQTPNEGNSEGESIFLDYQRAWYRLDRIIVFTVGQWDRSSFGYYSSSKLTLVHFTCFLISCAISTLTLLSTLALVTIHGLFKHCLFPYSLKVERRLPSNARCVSSCLCSPWYMYPS
jgi:hypothetical protein